MSLTKEQTSAMAVLGLTPEQMALAVATDKKAPKPKKRGRQAAKTNKGKGPKGTAISSCKDPSFDHLWDKTGELPVYTGNTVPSGLNGVETVKVRKVFLAKILPGLAKDGKIRVWHQGKDSKKKFTDTSKDMANIPFTWFRFNHKQGEKYAGLPVDKFFMILASNGFGVSASNRDGSGYMWGCSSEGLPLGQDKRGKGAAAKFYQAGLSDSE